MKKIKALPCLAAIVVGALFFAIGRGIGDWYADVLKGSGGMVTASELIGCYYAIPILCAIIAGYIAYVLTAD